MRTPACPLHRQRSLLHRDGLRSAGAFLSFLVFLLAPLLSGPLSAGESGDALRRMGLLPVAPSVAGESAGQTEPAPRAGGKDSPPLPATRPRIRVLRTDRTAVPHDLLGEPSNWSTVDWANPVRIVAADTDAETVSDATDAAREEAKENRRDPALLLEVGDGPHEKAAVSRALHLPKATPGAVELVVERIAGGAEIALALAVSAGGARTAYYESPPRPLPPNARTALRFDWTKPEWKSEASEWRHETRPPSLSPSAIYLILYGESDDARLRLTRLALAPEAPSTETSSQH